MVIKVTLGEFFNRLLGNQLLFAGAKRSLMRVESSNHCAAFHYKCYMLQRADIF
jgi:hypothetical protein